MIKDEDDIVDEVVEAKRQGYKFIKVFLDRSMIPRNHTDVTISGAVILRAFRKGTGMGGMPEFDFQARPGETMIFRFSRTDMEYLCWLYDDQGPGYFSPKGYNRDLLASHLDEKIFHVQDRDVQLDIEARHDWMKANPKQKRKTAIAKDLDLTSASVDDIDKQIAFLQQKKAEYKEHDNKPSAPKITAPITRQEQIAINKAKYKDEQRIKKNAYQREYRNKKNAKEKDQKKTELTNA